MKSKRDWLENDEFLNFLIEKNQSGYSCVYHPILDVWSFPAAPKVDYEKLVEESEKE